SIHAIVDGKVVVISESSVMSDLLFNDEDDIRADEAIHHMEGDSVERAITTDASLVTDPGAKKPHWGAYAQTRFETASKRSSDPPLSTGHTVGSGEDRIEQETDLTGFVPPKPHDSPLLGGHTPGSDEGRPNLLELMNICTKLSNRVLALKEAKTTQDKVITRLKLRVRRLKKKRKARTLQPMKRRLFKGRVENSTDKSLGENASKQGRNDDQTQELNLTNRADTKVIVEDKGSGEQGGSTADQVSTARPKVRAATPSTPPTTTTISGDEDLTIAQTLIKMKSEKAKKKGVAFRDVEEPPRLTRSTTTLQPLPTIDLKDKGKGVLVEEELEKLHKVKRRDQGLAQIESDVDLAQRIYEEELAELDRAQKERQKMTHEEQEMYTIEERARLLTEYFERRKKQLVAERAEAIRNKPPTRTQVRNRMITYLKHMDEEETVDPEILSTKYPIVDWESQILGNVDMEDKHVYKIIRANGNTSYHKSLSSMLRKFDRQDLVDLHKLVMKNFKDNTPKGYKLLLWGDLKVMFEPNAEDEIWKKRYPLIKELLEKMLNWKLKAEAESTIAFELLKFIKSQIEE
nr:hypothetical protein [Tanacetum cinerariifolium]